MNQQPSNDFEMSLGRLEAFSDGIFAVAVTLLVLNLVVPHSGLSATALLQQLADQWPAYLGYFTTFMTVGMVWIGHHQMLRYFERIDETILILNLLVLLFITLTPFTTGLLTSNIVPTDTGTDRVTVLVYGANWLLNGLVFGLMWRYAQRHHFLKPGISESRLRSTTRNFVGGSAVTAFGLLVTIFNPQIGLLIYLGIALSHAAPVLRIFSKPPPKVSAPAP